MSRLVRVFSPALVTALLAVAGCSSSQAQSDADDVYRQGLARSSGDTLGAMKIFEDGLTQYPNHTRMRFALARLQYDTGEAEHLEELRANGAARHAADDGHAAEAQKLDHEVQDHHAKALPYYRACKENLKLVIAGDGDTARKAWAYELLMRCDIFFADFGAAANDLEKAIDLGKPTGERLVEYQNFMKELRDASGLRKPAAN